MRAVFISVLIALIVILGGIWAYLLLNGAPEGVADIRRNLFGSGDAIVTTPLEAPILATEDRGDRTIPLGAPLTQVTDQAVAGAVIASVGSSTALRYVEKGTGHIYEISLESGVETRISNTTIPGAVGAVWAPSGERVVIETDVQGARGSMYLGSLSTSTAGTSVNLEGLNDTLDNAAFSQSGTLFYTIKDSAGTRAWARGIGAGSATELFSLPFQESIVLWDIWGAEGHYVYTKPASGFRGFLYRVTSGKLEKVAAGQTLSAVRPMQHILMITEDGGPGSYSKLIDTRKDTESFMEFAAVKEKCAAGTAIWCAANAETGAGYPVAWYQGRISYNDSIYRIDPDTGNTALELDPETLAREPIDITDMSAGPDGRVVFRNKVDDSLWLLNPGSGF